MNVHISILISRVNAADAPKSLESMTSKSLTVKTVQLLPKILNRKRERNIHRWGIK